MKSLKELQAEWLEAGKDYGIASPIAAAVRTECAAALTPYIEEQEKDREMINAFTVLVSAVHGEDHDYCALCTLVKEARAQLQVGKS